MITCIPCGMPLGLTGEILGVSHVAIFLEVAQGGFLDKIFEESPMEFVSCRTPGEILDEIPGLTPGKDPATKKLWNSWTNLESLLGYCRANFRIFPNLVRDDTGSVLRSGRVRNRSVATPDKNGHNL